MAASAMSRLPSRSASLARWYRYDQRSSGRSGEVQPECVAPVERLARAAEPAGGDGIEREGDKAQRHSAGVAESLVVPPRSLELRSRSVELFHPAEDEAEIEIDHRNVARAPGSLEDRPGG
jgi:hypothetical protein